MIDQLNPLCTFPMGNTPRNQHLLLTEINVSISIPFYSPYILGGKLSKKVEISVVCLLTLPRQIMV